MARNPGSTRPPGAARRGGQARRARDRGAGARDGGRPFAGGGGRRGRGEGGRGRLMVTPVGVGGAGGWVALNGAATARARALPGTERSGPHEIAGRSFFGAVFLPPPQLALCGA